MGTRDWPSLMRAADKMLDGGLAVFVTSRRNGGESWERIARALWAETDQVVDVSGPTVQDWHGRLTEAVAS